MLWQLLLRAGSSGQQQDRHRRELRARFDRESDAVRKAKLMPELGEAQFAEIREKVRARTDSRSDCRRSSNTARRRRLRKALDASGIDAEKHPNGFKQLEISLRESLRRLNEMLPGMTADEQQPFLEARKELNEMDQRLVHELFPRRVR